MDPCWSETEPRDFASYDGRSKPIWRYLLLLLDIWRTARRLAYFLPLAVLLSARTRAPSHQIGMPAPLPIAVRLSWRSYSTDASPPQPASQPASAQQLRRNGWTFGFQAFSFSVIQSFRLWLMWYRRPVLSLDFWVRTAFLKFFAVFTSSLLAVPPNYGLGNQCLLVNGIRYRSDRQQGLLKVEKFWIVDVWCGTRLAVRVLQ
jgi:hypothetical protein